MSGIAYTPQPDHEPRMIEGVATAYPKGTVYECDCGTTWVCQGMVKPYMATGHVSASLEWKRESKRARRKRERTTSLILPMGGRVDVTPLFMPSATQATEPVAPPLARGVTVNDYEVVRASERPTEPATPSDGTHPATTEPPRGVTVTDAHGHHWIRLGDLWVRQDGPAPPQFWATFAEQRGPLRTTWTDPSCPAPQPHAPAE